jgi:hypothetical protein
MNQNEILKIAAEAGALKAQVQRLERVNAELLEALEDLFGWQTLAPDDVVAAARAAIEKARGET